MSKIPAQKKRKIRFITVQSKIFIFLFYSIYFVLIHIGGSLKSYLSKSNNMTWKEKAEKEKWIKGERDIR